MHSELKKEMITIEGMSCGHCITAVTKALMDTKSIIVDGVTIGHALIRYGQRLDRSVIANALEEAGFKLAS